MNNNRFKINNIQRGTHPLPSNDYLNVQNFGREPVVLAGLKLRQQLLDGLLVPFDCRALVPRVEKVNAHYDLANCALSRANCTATSSFSIGRFMSSS